jgi:formate hydrogenlyase transcriptional activator
VRALAQFSGGNVTNIPYKSKMTTKALQESEERLHNPVKSVTDAVLVTNSEGQLTDVAGHKRAEDTLRQYPESLEQMVEERTAQLRQSEERHRALLEINNAIIAHLDRESLFDAIAQTLCKVLPFDRASLTLYDPVKDVSKLHALTGTLPRREILPEGATLPQHGSRPGPGFDQKPSLRVQDLREEPDLGPVDHLVEEWIRSLIIVPLMSKRGAIGTLSVATQALDQYSDEDVKFVREVAEQVALAVENMLAYEEIAQLKARLEQENLYLREEIKSQHTFEEIIGQGPAIQKVLKAAEMVAATDASVLLLGETGTGKELLVRAVHNLSLRKGKPLVTVNCATLPAGLVESELFGHEKGAFTGALARKIGRFELAHGGTLFLDEIGDLPLDLQAKLLRVLQEGTFERVGGLSTIKVDVRVIAATNWDLENAMQEGTFRPDLYYRLSVFPIRIPPLRERREDIPLLVRYFVMKCGGKLGKQIESIPQKLMEALLAYPWPGNVRELENVIERAVILSPGHQLALGEWLPKPALAPGGGRVLTLAELDREHIVQVLELTGGQVSGEKGAAKLLGMKPTTLESKIKRLGIDKNQTGRARLKANVKHGLAKRASEHPRQTQK